MALQYDGNVPFTITPVFSVYSSGEREKKKEKEYVDNSLAF